VVREALVERLRRTSAPLVLVNAPAGYGKTTLLTQWVERDGRPFAWLQLDRIHDDPVAFLTYLASALTNVVDVDDRFTDLLAEREPPIEEAILPGLGSAVEAAAPFLIVLDDAHLVGNPACWRCADVILDQLPDGARLALASRGEPPLPLPRRRANGELIEVLADDLRLTSEEARSVLGLHGCDIGDDDLVDLLRVTEGWPTGVYLAVLAGDGRPAKDALARLRGDRREIAGYLTTEVLDRQPADVQQFLLRTAVLDQLSSSLCRALTGQAEAAGLLERLARDSLFVTPLDDHDAWYRYHSLFAELLRAQLERLAPETMDDLHRRAAAWYEAHGDGERAVRHAVAAGDADAVADLAALTCDVFIQAGQNERARQLLEAFSDEQLGAHPALAITAGALANYLPDARVQRWAGLSARLRLDDSPTPVGAASLRSWQTVWRTSLARDGVTRMLDDATLACELEAEGPDPSWLCFAQMLRCMALYLLGRVHHAQRALEATARTAAGHADEESWVLGLQTLIAVDQGRWDDAVEFDRHIREKAAHPESLPPILAHALILAYRDDPDLVAYLDTAERDARESFLHAEWRMILAATVFAGIALRRDDLATAERWTAEAEAILRRYPDAGILRGRTKHLRKALEERRMAEPFTAAERRILDLLPTQLTAGQIAARLFLTRNTVKSHTSHIYRKLGVTSRTAAVETARRLGLL
jgi:LuxR family maltose regulon positive regulatory protein